MLTHSMLTHATAAELFELRRTAWLREHLDGYLALWAEDTTFRGVGGNECRLKEA